MFPDFEFAIFHFSFFIILFLIFQTKIAENDKRALYETFAPIFMHIVHVSLLDKRA